MPGQRTAKELVNNGNPFRFGALECLGLLVLPNEKSQKLESVLEIVDAKSPAKLIRSIPLPPTDKVDLLSSPDGRFLAVSTNTPRQIFTVPLDEIRKNPTLLRTAAKTVPAVRIIDAITGEIFTNDVWEKQYAEGMQFDPNSTRLLCTSMTPQFRENQLLYNLKSRRVEANGPVVGRPNRTLPLPDGRIVIGNYQHVAIYKPSGGQWSKEVERTDLNTSDKRMIARRNANHPFWIRVFWTTAFN